MADSAEIQGVISAPISRRRVLHAAVWAAPIIVIAQAAPATAASTVPASIALGGASATRFDPEATTSRVEATAQVVQTAGTAVVTSITVRFEFTSTLVSASQTPTVLEGAGWTLLTSGTAVGITYFTYTYNAALLGTSTTALKISAAVAQNNTATLSTTIKADAQDAGAVAVPQVSWTGVAGVAARLVVDSSGGWNKWDGSETNIQINQTRWDGSYTVAAGPISGITMVFEASDTWLDLPSAASVVMGTANGWVVNSVTQQAGKYRIVFARPTGNTVSNESRLLPNFTFKAPLKPGAGAGSFTVYATGFSGSTVVNSAVLNPSVS